MNELEVVESMGIISSPEIHHILDKSSVAIRQQLNQLVKRHEVQMIEFKIRGSVRRRIYMTNELYDFLFI